MPNEDLKITRFFREHLTAEMIRTELDLDLDGSKTVDEGIEYLSGARYDLVILRVRDNHKYVALSDLQEFARKKPGNGSVALSAKAKEFPSTRIVSSDMPIRSAADALSKGSFPLLVAGQEGPAFILTKSDFASPAGIAAALLLAALVDSLLDRELQRIDAEAVLAALETEVVDRLRMQFKTKQQWEEELGIISLMNLRSRFIAFNACFEPVCSQNDAEWLTKQRNELSHGRLDNVTGEDLLKFIIQMDDIFVKLSGETTEGGSAGV